MSLTQFTRRQAVIFTVGWLGLSACVTHPTKPPVNTIVLVHGAWHGGWVWDEVATKLQEKGWSVEAPTLPGLEAVRTETDKPVSEITLNDHIQHVGSILTDKNLTNVILVGHSYGGMVITGVAAAYSDRIKSLVYLDAAVPKNGETMISQGEPRSKEEYDAVLSQLNALVTDNSMRVLPPEMFGVGSDRPRIQTILKRELRPHPFRTWTEPIKLPDTFEPEHFSPVYIHSNDPALPQSSFPWHYAQLKNDPSWRTVAIRTGHNAMMTEPDLVTCLLSVISKSEDQTRQLSSCL